MDNTPLASSTLPPRVTPPQVEGLRVLEMVGRGGQAAVYRAYQEGNDRIVALRVVRNPYLDDSVLRRFDRERRALGRISGHPGIVSMLESGMTGEGQPYLVLEYAPNGNLADRLGEARLDVDSGTEFGVVLAGAIEMAHRAGVVHGDVKPQNILRSTYGDWQLGDFGVATLTGAHTTSSSPVSFAHTAPESFDQAGATAAADVYSLASTLLTVLTGTEPFAAREGEMRAATIRRIVLDPAPDPRRHGVPSDVAEVIVRAMAKDPSDRPASAAAFGAALNAARQQLGLSVVDMRIGTVDDLEGATSEPSADVIRSLPRSRDRNRSATRDVGGPVEPPGLTSSPGMADHRLPPSRSNRGRRWWRAIAVLLAGFATVGAATAATAADLDDIGNAPADFLTAITPDGVGNDDDGTRNRGPGRRGRPGN